MHQCLCTGCFSVNKAVLNNGPLLSTSHCWVSFGSRRNFPVPMGRKYFPAHLCSPSFWGELAYGKHSLSFVLCCLSHAGNGY